MSSYGIWLSAAGMKIGEHRQALLANNIANAQTTGFKQDLAVIRQRAVESGETPAGVRFSHPVLDGLPGGVNVRPTFTSFAQGPIQHTGRSLDVAIQGDGFFTVSDGSATRYTRDGAFTLNRDGELALTAGEGRWRLLDRAGAAIRIDPAGGPVEVSGDGTIRQGGDEAAVLALMTPDDPQSLRKVGEGLFDGGGGRLRAADGALVPESLEGSNFNAVSGLAEMIEVTRAYEMNATLLRLQDEAAAQAVSTVGRLA